MSDKRILLVDDHALVRGGVRALIDGFDGFAVVGEAADGREALAVASALGPDIVVMDIGMPGLNGLDATLRILQACPDTVVLALSMHAGEHYVSEALRAGARGYVVKDAAPEELERALRTVAAGRRYLSAGLRPNGLLAAARGEAAGGGGPALTSRQREILQLVAEGHSTRDIAARLCISVKTVETHRAQLMQRLGIYDVAGLTRHAIRIGLVSADG
ncbi:MAG: response regulator [Rhodocyclaceae bacterium]